MWSLMRFAWWRQSLYPAEFRIPVGEPIALADALPEIISELVKHRSANAPTAPDHPKEVQLVRSDARATEIPASFIRPLCNELFRLQRTARSMSQDEKGRKEYQGMTGAIERLDETLKEEGIEFFDLTGRPWDARDIDFEPKGDPIPVRGLLQSRIGICEIPAVKLRGRIIQRAKGIVEVPSREGPE